MTSDTYVRYDDSVEVIQPDEEAQIAEICASIKKSSECAFGKWSHATRGQHAKSHGILKGKLIVPSDLPDHLRQGLFATPKPDGYDIIVRFSTGHGNCRSDRAPSPRGMAIKVFGVEGAKALADDQSANHDILLANRPIYFADTAAYVRVQKLLLERQPGISDWFVRVVSFLSLATQQIYHLFGREAPLWVKAIGDHGYNILGETFHSMAAIRFGDYIAKISVAPASPAVKAFEKKPATRGHNGLRESVVDFFKSNGAEYELRAQLCTDLKTMPVENASVVWPDKKEDGGSPHQPVARIVLPAQDADSPESRVYADEVLSFDSWRCLAAHRPLGSIMRLRRQVYKLSSDFRHEKNARPFEEPKNIAELRDREQALVGAHPTTR